MVSLLWPSLLAFASPLQRSSSGGGGKLRVPRRSIRMASSSSSSSSTTTMTRQQQQKDEKIMQDVLYRVRNVNYMPTEIRQSLIPFRVDGKLLGKVRPSMAQRLTQTIELGQVNNNSLPPVFTLQKDPQSNSSSSSSSSSSAQQQLLQSDYYLTLNDAVAGTTMASRTLAVAEVMQALREQGIVAGWRDEAYPIATGFYDPPVFTMERAAVPILGGLEYGVHINGLVVVDDDDNDENGIPRTSRTSPIPDGSNTKMWMARRSATKSKYPGMLDHIVAGGQPAGMSLMDNVIKECLEEANIPEALTRAGIRPAGAVSYETYNPKQDTVSRAVLFNYDLYLPPDFQPTPVDGEVEEFFLWTIDQLLESMAQDYHDPIKPNCYSVIIDYLLRAGHLSPEIPGYLDVMRELRSGDCC